MFKKEQNISPQRAEYLKDTVYHKRFVVFMQIFILLFAVAMWEVLANVGIIDAFIASKPTRVIKTLASLSKNDLWLHFLVTSFETLTGFVLGVVFGMIISAMLWWSKTFSEIMEPYLVVLNSLPKIALGPIIIIWVGAGTKAIIVMALAISLIVTVLELLEGFKSTDKDTIKMAKTFGASKGQIFTKVVFVSNLPCLMNSLKINIGLSLVGVIAGEFLVSKAGLGYLIVYGGQVFQLDLVMASVIILAVFAAVLYRLIVSLENLVVKKSHFK